MRGKAFKHFYLSKYSLLTENSKFTNFTIGGLLAGPHRSPLIQCSCFQDIAQSSSSFETCQPTDIQGTITWDPLSLTQHESLAVKMKMHVS